MVSNWERWRAENQIQRKNERGGESLLEQLREAVQAKEACLSSWEQWREYQRKNERQREAKSREKEAEGTVNFLGIWVVLFVLICDFFVVNFLGRICSLSYWFLFCLENSNVIFGQWFWNCEVGSLHGQMGAKFS